MRHAISLKRELFFSRFALTLTLIFTAVLFHTLLKEVYGSYFSATRRVFMEGIVYTTATFFIAYGNVLYQICLAGYYKRRLQHKEESRATLERFYHGEAPSLSILIPSYKEERNVIWQTMMSAALAEYVQKNVVLLIDDPYQPRVLEDIVKLDATRMIPGALQKLFDEPAALYRKERMRYSLRLREGKSFPAIELNRLAMHYHHVAAWLDARAAEVKAGRKDSALEYSESFFIETVLSAPATAHRALAQEMLDMISSGASVDHNYIERHYSRLVGLFSVTFSSFERKKYNNLSHEANKAMNLNSYIALIGRSWKEVVCEGGLELHETSRAQADFTIEAVDYINTIDADSLMTSQYALKLIDVMERPENARIAVIQSPCSSFYGSPDPMTRVAGACIDVQFQTHQGYTAWGASFWVGANAMLRRAALEDIRETHIHNGHPVSVYIQDRTVIEDTESTIDLVHKGWKLYNYPERMTFSPTPPDFGSLLIQRRRWSNGGLIILPKLLRYTLNAPKSLALLKEFFMRFHLLASTTTVIVSALLLFFYPFGTISSSPYLVCSALPGILLFMRDLRNNGYKYHDAVRAWALTLMLMPIVVGGVLKQFQQMLTGKKIPFGRTPKVPGRTAAPALYCLLEIALFTAFMRLTANSFMQGQWISGAFSLVNTSLMAYALVHFIGLRATYEDVTASVMSRFRRAFHHAEIIPFPVTGWIPPSLRAAVRKRA